MQASGEDIDLHFIPVDEFFDRLERQEFRDAKIIIGGYWLRDHLARAPQMEKGQTKTELYAVKDRPHRIIGIMTGDIADIQDVDVWVNPENTNMQMDRYFGRSVSAAIRWGGASKRDVGSEEVVETDLIADDLRRKLGNRNYVGLQDVIETTAGELAGTRNVRAILHVAVAEGHYEQRMRTSSADTGGVHRQSSGAHRSQQSHDAADPAVQVGAHSDARHRHQRPAGARRRTGHGGARDGLPRCPSALAADGHLPQCLFDQRPRALERSADGTRGKKASS